MSAVALALAAVLFTQTSVEKNRKCPNIATKLPKWIELRLASAYSRRWRKKVSTTLSAAILKEAKRHKIDPVVMATIGWIESDYRPWVRGPYRGKYGTNRRAAEVGVWQLIPFHATMKRSYAANRGCAPSKRASKWVWKRYRRLMKKHPKLPCHAPDIGKMRMRIGRWSLAEMRDLKISTYIAGHELRVWLDACKKRKPKGHKLPRPTWLSRWRKKNASVKLLLIERYLHWNWGPRVRKNHYYRRRLITRYSKVRDYVCK